MPSGIEVKADCRSQWESRQQARRELTRRLASAATEQSVEARNLQRTSQIHSAERPAKAFTYNEQRDEVVDHDGGRRWRMTSFMKGRW